VVFSFAAYERFVLQGGFVVEFDVLWCFLEFKSMFWVCEFVVVL